MSSNVSNSRLDSFRKNIVDAFSKVPSGATRWLGGGLKVAEAGKLVAEFEVREDMTNPMKTLHGGTAAMIMDDMIGIMVYLLGYPNAHTSVNLNCDFLSPAGIGTRLTATAITVRQGRNIVHCECTIHDHQGKLVAKSASNLIMTPFPLEEPAA